MGTVTKFKIHLGAKKPDLAAQISRKKAIHRSEWEYPRAVASQSFESLDMEKMRMAKVYAETLKIIQDGERRAWGMDVAEKNQKPDQSVVQVINYADIDEEIHEKVTSCH